MKKTIYIEGMSCSHCVNRVKNTLEEINDVNNVEVNLEESIAILDLKHDVKDKVVKEAIEDAGYEVKAID